MAIRFPIVTTFDDKAVGKADKAFSALGKKFAAIFSVGAVIKFGKDSVKAFQDAEKEANLLRAQLESINLGFASPFVNQYIDNLALLSGISGGVLTDAFNSLSQATEDVTTAQRLLNTALDVAAGTGKDLRTVTSALQRAYLGETTALAKLRIGYTTADLKARDFDEVLAELQNKFQGSSAKAADTLAGKMARLTESVEQAQEAFGEGLVKGLQDSQVEIDQLQKDVIGLGDALGYAAGQATGFFAKAFQDIVKDFEESDGAFQKFVRSLVKSTAEVTRLEEERGRAGLRARNRILKAEQSITKTKKEQDKLADKEKKNALAIAKAKSLFDIEKIQIEAALQGQITEEERIRLQLMKAIANENVDRIQQLTDKLKKAQEDTAKLANDLLTLEAGNPFRDWDTYTEYALGLTAKMRASLDELYIRLNDFLRLEKGVGAGTPPGTPPSTPPSTPPFTPPSQPPFTPPTPEDGKKAAEDAAAAAAEAEAAAAQAAAALAAAKSEEELAAAQAAFLAAEAARTAAAILLDSAAALDYVEASTAAIDADALLAASESALNILEAEAAAVDASLAFIDATSLLDYSGLAAMAAGVPTTEIYVTVEGNVTSSEDLAEVITDIQYDYQRTGKGLLFSSIAI